MEETIQNDENFHFLAEAMPQFVWIADANGTLNYLNEAFYKFSGLTPEYVTMENLIKIVHPDDAELNLNKWMHSVTTGELFLLEHRIKKFDGQYRWHLSRAAARKNDGGEIKLWLGTSIDIDDIKKQDQIQKDFIKMASHELNTPVTTIKGYVQLLLHTHPAKDDALLNKSLSVIERQVNKMAHVISDLVEMTNVEAGNLCFKFEVFNVSSVLQDAINYMKTLSTNHSIILVDHHDAMVYADRYRITQVLQNLFTNAFKYSHTGQNVIANLFITSAEVIISIKDFGIGISKQDQYKIFDKFYKASDQDDNTYPGFGLGLFMVKEIISRHNGKVWMESDKNNGTIVYFSLPIYNKLPALHEKNCEHS